MFVRYFTELPLPPPLVEEALLEAPSRWLPGLLDAACGRMAELLSDGGLGGPYRAEEGSVVDIGPVRSGADWAVLPISRRGTGGPAALPELSGDIEIAALGASRTQLLPERGLRPAGGDSRRSRRPPPLPSGGGGRGQGLPRSGQGGHRGARRPGEPHRPRATGILTQGSTSPDATDRSGPSRTPPALWSTLPA